MSITRSQLVRGPSKVTWNSITFHSKEDIAITHAPSYAAITSSLHGEVDKVKTDLVIQIPVRLWGAWENISTLFPSALLNPAAGASVFGATDLPLVILGKNGDQVTYHNAALTQMANLRLGVDGDTFSADCVFTAILANGTNPEDAAAYYTLATGQSYSETAFAKTNFKRSRFSGAWGTRTGWTTITPQDGFNVSWALNMKPVTVDGLGTVDMTLVDMVASCRCIPIGPTLAQIEAQAKFGSGSGQAHGVLLGANSDDLTLTGTGVSVVLKAAGLVQSGYVFGTDKLRMGEVAWATTRGFSSGTPVAAATVT